ncbi:MAG: hypothetical protein ABIQ52_15725 [Vicinamibacterales bacterium]
MPFAYGAAGLTLVADRGLHGFPALPASSSSADADLLVQVGTPPAWACLPATPFYTSPYSDPRGLPVVQVTRIAAGFAFAYADGTRFWIDEDGTHIWMTSERTDEDACTYLAGPVLAFALRLRGEFSLHASAVVTGAGAVAIAGPHGAGKSTTAAALGMTGCPVLTDDILRVTSAEADWHAHPFGGILRLWPDGETMVFGRGDRLDPITPFWDKRALPIGDDGVPAAEQSLPLAGVAFLTADSTATHGVVLSALSPAAAAVRLAENSSVEYLLDGPRRAREFHQVVSIAARVPCVEIARPAGALSLDEVLSTLNGWVRTLGSRAPVRA